MKWWLFVAIWIVGGCQSTQNSTSVPAPSSNLEPQFSARPDQQYGRQVLDLLDQFDAAYKTAILMDDSEIQAFAKSNKVSENTIKNLQVGLRDEREIVGAIQHIVPPKKFEEFHQQVLKSVDQKSQDLAKLIEAVKAMDKKKIDQVLKDAEAKGRARQTQMNKILGGQTAEKYLGL